MLARIDISIGLFSHGNASNKSGLNLQQKVHYNSWLRKIKGIMWGK